MMVEPETIVAEIERRSVHVLDVAAELGVDPTRARASLRVDVGARVEAGQLVARRGFPYRRALLAPVSGTLLASDEQGRLLLQGDPLQQGVAAEMRARVVRVTPERAILLEGYGALIQGVWGSGPTRAGVLHMMVSQPDEALPLLPEGTDFQDAILIAGHLASTAALRRLIEGGAGGLILGGMASHLLPLARQAPFPIFLSEGFGQLPLCTPVFDLLAQLAGRPATLSGAAALHAESGRPELFVPLPGRAMPSVSPGPLATGDRVRALGGPRLGQVGTVQEAGGQRVRFSNEVEAVACVVHWENGELAMVPFPMLERLLR